MLNIFHLLWCHCLRYLRTFNIVHLIFYIAVFVSLNVTNLRGSGEIEVVPISPNISCLVSKRPPRRPKFPIKGPPECSQTPLYSICSKLKLQSSLLLTLSSLPLVQNNNLLSHLVEIQWKVLFWVRNFYQGSDSTRQIKSSSYTISERRSPHLWLQQHLSSQILTCTSSIPGIFLVSPTLKFHLFDPWWNWSLFNCMQGLICLLWLLDLVSKEDILHSHNFLTFPTTKSFFVGKRRTD